MIVLEDHEGSSLSCLVALICDDFGSVDDFGVPFCADPDGVAIVWSKAARMKGHNLEEVQIKRSL